MRTAALGDLVTARGGGTPRKSVAEYYGGGIPWVTPKDMKRLVVDGSEVTLTSAGLKNSPANLVPAGSVLVVVRSGVLKHTLPVALTDRPVTVNQDMKALVPSADLDASYLARFLKARQSQILSWVRATTADNFPVSKLLEMEIALPGLDEQRRIAAILDHADALRAKRRQVLAHLDSLTQSIFHDMFSDVSASATVADVAASTKGSIRTGPFGSQLLHSEFVDEGVAVLGLDNVVGNEFRWGERRFITTAKYESLSRYTVQPGDVLISIMGTIGRCAVVPAEIPTAINTKHICAISPNLDLVEPSFLRGAFLWHPDSRAHLGRQTKGSIMAGLNMRIIKSMPVPVPPLPRQREFARRAAEQQHQRIAVERALVTADELFASLQSRAFRGEL